MTETTNPIALKDILLTISPLIKVVVDTFITPKLASLKQRFNLDYKKYHIPTDEHFSEYFHRMYKKLSVVNTLVFNNSQRILKDIYIPLTISENRNSHGHIIESYPAELMEKYEKILITDTAGMGKSTMMKRIFLDIIDNKHGIPIIIELRRLTSNKTIIQEIHEQINSIDKIFDEQLLLEFIKEGGFIFILDGYDEISLKERTFTTENIQNFISKASNNKFLLTSRPENALTSFGDFQSFMINPLRKKEAFNLLRKYDNQGQLSSLLIKKLEENYMSNIEEFLTNPLLVSLLFTAFQFKQTIPFKKYLFYRQVYDANFESHDLTKGDSFIHEKYTKLEVDDFHKILRHIGFSCLKKQKIEFNKDELLSLIQDSKKFCIGIKFKESDFLKDLLITVPLFMQDGNYYRWAHKSLQEYFAAQFIYLDLNENKNRTLKSIYFHSDFYAFINVLDLFYDMDYKSFRNVIIYEFLKQFRVFINDSHFDGETEISSDLLTERREYCFTRKVMIYSSKISNLPFSDDFDKVIQKYFTVDNEFKTKFFSATSSIIGNDLAYLEVNEIHNSLLQLLNDKRHQIVKMPRKFKITEFAKDVNKSKIDDLEHFPIEISIDKVNFFSEIGFFELGNRILRYVTTDTIIDYEKAFRLLAEIEEDIKNESEESLLLTE